jgi:hypothetical protein
VLHTEGGGMTPRFEVGEVAEYCTGVDWREVTIIGPLRERSFINVLTGEELTRPTYVIEAPWMRLIFPRNSLIAGPHQLRKRRPPQDWVKLCELDKIPTEGVPV